MAPPFQPPQFIAHTVRDIPRSCIREFFEVVQNQAGVISLGVGEPDFVTPEHIWRAAFDACAAGQTKDSPNAGLQELRELLSQHLERLDGVR